MDKIKQYSKDSRAKIVKRNDCGTQLLRISIQQAHILLGIFRMWHTVSWVDIEIDNYWVVPGHERDGPLTLSYQFGGKREVWPPDIFNLDKRVNELYSRYAESMENVNRNRKAIEEQLKRLNA